ncbi:hypothetical protein WMO79_01080 [Micrococcaceae bacterium Sec7.4]
MGKTEIVTASAYVVTAEAIASSTGHLNNNFADVSDMAGRTVDALLREIAWARRVQKGLIADKERLSREIGQADDARVQAESTLQDTKAAFKISLKALAD